MGKLFTPLTKIRRLEIFYLAIIGILMLMVVGTPFLVHRSTALTSHVLKEQEVLETLLLAVLLSLAYVLSRFYRRLLRTYREEIQRLALNNSTMQGRLTDAFKYIGKVNVQLQEIRSAFSLLNQTPRSRKDFKNLLRMFAQKALTIANTDWVLVRIIDRASLRTVIEHLESRGKAVALHASIGSKSIVQGEPVPGRIAIRCENKNLDITVACIFPRDELTWEEKVLLEAVTSEVEMLFLGFTIMHLHRANPTTTQFPPHDHQTPT